MFVILTISIVLVTYILWTRRELYKLSWKLPGPFALPFIGNAKSMHPNSEFLLINCNFPEHSKLFQCFFQQYIRILINFPKNMKVRCVFGLDHCYSFWLLMQKMSKFCWNLKIAWINRTHFIKWFGMDLVSMGFSPPKVCISYFVIVKANGYWEMNIEVKMVKQRMSKSEIERIFFYFENVFEGVFFWFNVIFNVKKTMKIKFSYLFYLLNVNTATKLLINAKICHNFWDFSTELNNIMFSTAQRKVDSDFHNRSQVLFHNEKKNRGNIN